MSALPAPLPYGETRDAFHRGAFYLVQPSLKGHRSGIDAMILAGAVPSDFKGRVADLGAGAGAAGLAVASRCAQTQVTLIERSPDMLLYAQKSCALSENAHMHGRLTCLQADVTMTGPARHAAGLADNQFDYVIMNPPFNQQNDRATPDDLKAQAHVMHEGMFESWIRTASGILRPRGQIAIIARPANISEMLAALERRFGSIAITPIHARPEEPAIRVVITGIKGSRAPVFLAPALILHKSSGHEFTPRAESLINGCDSL
ncbi:MAG: methyltransferase [Brucellaceae bacterium]|jgi:tRNA1(Val) A37 N6-methylase TrmN6|nr:methyltransferase [Brucellaceae bacterium]